MSDTHVAAISEYLAGQASPPVEVGPEDDIFATGALDSLGITDLIAFLETSHGIDIPLCDVTVENFATIRAMSAYVDRRVAGK